MRVFLVPLLLLTSATAAPPLDDAEFARLHKQLQPEAGEGWTSIPWKTSLVQACVQAAREKKPLFMVSRSGNPLGCV